LLFTSDSPFKKKRASKSLRARLEFR
jgi:hypothetical protein